MAKSINYSQKELEAATIVQKMNLQILELEQKRREQIYMLAKSLFPLYEDGSTIECEINGTGVVIQSVCCVSFSDVPMFKYKCKTSKNKFFYTTSKDIKK